MSSLEAALANETQARSTSLASTQQQVNQLSTSLTQTATDIQNLKSSANDSTNGYNTLQQALQKTSVISDAGSLQCRKLGGTIDPQRLSDVLPSGADRRPRGDRARAHEEGSR
eukprot:scaffold223494_cov27-Tisochrysis_lutea.AAC.1